MAPKLPRMYWGEIIYATPGSGKTFVSNKYDNVCDADELIVEAIDELTKFDCSTERWGENVDRRIIICNYFLYIKFNPRLRAKVYQLALRKMKDRCKENQVVLLGTRDLMHKADRVFIQSDSDIVRNGFNVGKEKRVYENLPKKKKVHLINGYLENNLQKICQMTKKG
jgi:hypothetical protein